MPCRARQEDWTQVVDFTPYDSLAGGALIGLAASLLWIGLGRIAGISGITANVLLGARGDRSWRALFLLGLVAAGFVFARLEPAAFAESPRPLWMIAAAGLLVGVGTRLGGGCTSGHGVCGVSRLSPRSLLATGVFMATGIATVTLLRWLGVAS
jgi:uncharacterized membrane protein YedE/YeeE